MTPGTRQALIEVAEILKARYEESRHTTEELRVELAAIYTRLGQEPIPMDGAALPERPIASISSTDTDSHPEPAPAPASTSRSVRQLVGEYMTENLKFTSAGLTNAVLALKPDANPTTIKAELNHRYMDEHQAVRTGVGEYVSLLHPEGSRLYPDPPPPKPTRGRARRGPGSGPTIAELTRGFYRDADRFLGREAIAAVRKLRPGVNPKAVTSALHAAVGREELKYLGPGEYQRLKPTPDVAANAADSLPFEPNGSSRRIGGVEEAGAKAPAS